MIAMATSQARAVLRGGPSALLRAAGRVPAPDHEGVAIPRFSRPGSLLIDFINSLLDFLDFWVDYGQES
jgi:hypothetical protein